MPKHHPNSKKGKEQRARQLKRLKHQNDGEFQLYLLMYWCNHNHHDSVI
jgi:hypothetical protein